MSRRRRTLLGAVVLPLVGSLAAVLAGCLGGEDGDAGGSSPEVVPLPAGLTAYVDQSRLLRVTRTAFVRLVDDDPDRELTVTRAEISSPRFGTLTWAGEKTFDNEADLEFEMPPGRCGGSAEARVRLTYRVDDGSEQVSDTTAADRYDAIALLLDRDCAEETLASAAELRLGDVGIVGTGRRSVLELPVTLTPTGARDDVAFAGFEDTVLFRGTDGSATVGAAAPVPIRPGGPPVEVLLRLVPTRCDPHALAEDKVGTLIGVRVVAPGLDDPASFYLPIGDDRRAALRGFFATHCGL